MNRFRSPQTTGIFIIALAIITLLYIAQPVKAIDYTYDSLGRLIKVVYQPGQEISYSYDSGGNILSITATGFDDTPPVTSIKLEGEAGQDNWYRSDVKVSLSAEDDPEGTGVVKTEYSYDEKTWTTYTDPIVFTAEGQTDLYYRSLDGADNLEAAQKTTIKIDKTASVIEAATTPPATAFGWHNSNVTVHFNASDALSGIDTVSPDAVISSEGANQSVTGIVTDKAGNTASVTVDGINLDKTPPVTISTSDREANQHGWYKDNVEVSLSATDKEGGSGVVKTEYSMDNNNWTDYTTPITISTEGINNIYYRSADLADNHEASNQLTIKIDKTPPTISGAPTTEANKNG